MILPKSDYCDFVWNNLAPSRYKSLERLQTRPGEGGGGEGVLPYKSDGGAGRKISKTTLNGTRILFCGRVPIHFHPPLRGTNSTTTNCITGTANFNSDKDSFWTLFSQGLFESIFIHQEPITWREVLPCHVVFMDQIIFRTVLARI